MPHAFESKELSTRTESGIRVTRATQEQGPAPVVSGVAHDFGQIAVTAPTEAALAADGPEHDFVYSGVCYVKVYVNGDSVDIATMAMDEFTAKQERQAAKKFAESPCGLPETWGQKPWVYHPNYTGRWKAKYDRWGALDLHGKTPLTCRNCQAKSSGPLSAEEILSFYQSKLPDRRIPGLEYPEKPSEYVVLLLTDPKTKLIYTYAFWNEDFTAKKAGYAKTVQGEYAYYSFDRPPDFESKWELKIAPEFLSAMDVYLAGKPFTRESGFRPGSYEAYRASSEVTEILENDKKVVIPLAQAFGKTTPEGAGWYYIKLRPMSPPLEIVANFDTGEFGISSLVDAPPDFSTETFFTQLRDVVMYMTYYPSVSIVIEGQTSRAGHKEKNKYLSLKRAQSIRTYMLEHAKEWSGQKLSDARITATGTGSAAAEKAGKLSNDDDVNDRKVVLTYVVKP